MKSLQFFIFCIIYAAFTNHLAHAAYTCTELDKQRKCPVFNNVGIGGSNYPSPTMIQIRPVQNALGETSITFETPFCRSCGFVFSYYPISYDEGYNTLVSDDNEFTSLNPAIMQQGTWNDWWSTGNSFCDANASGKLMNSGNGMMSLEMQDACTASRTLQFQTFNQKRELTLPNGKNAYVLTTTPLYAELTTQIYAQAMYPFSLSTPAEKYATRRSVYQFKTRYLLQAEVFADASVISQREIVVKTTESSPHVLQVDLQLKTSTGNYWIEDSCAVHDSAWGMQVLSQVVQGNIVTLKMLASHELDRYTGVIQLKCSTERCRDSGTCDPHIVNDIVVQVDQDSPSEIVTTSKFTPTISQFVGPADSPFQSENLLGSSGNHWVSLGIGQEEYLAGFNSHVSHLRMCSGACSSSPEYNLLLIKNSQPNDQLFINRLGLRLFDNNEMRNQRPDISGSAPLGLSFLYEAVKSLKYTNWHFEIAITFEPTGSKRGEGLEERTLMIRGTTDEAETEEAYVVKSVDLLPKTPTSAVQDLETNTTDKMIAILVPSIAGGLCLVCMFSAIALLGLVLCMSVVRKSRKTSSGVVHNRMDDMSVPSDSDAELRGNAV